MLSIVPSANAMSASNILIWVSFPSPSPCGSPTRRRENRQDRLHSAPKGATKVALWGAARLSETSGCGKLNRNRRYRDGRR